MAIADEPDELEELLESGLLMAGIARNATLAFNSTVALERSYR